jgi:hypothetical protein
VRISGPGHLLLHPLMWPRQHHRLLQQHPGLHGADCLGQRAERRGPVCATTERRVLYSHVGRLLQITSTRTRTGHSWAPRHVSRLCPSECATGIVARESLESLEDGSKE